MLDITYLQHHCEEAHSPQEEERHSYTLRYPHHFDNVDGSHSGPRHRVAQTLNAEQNPPTDKASDFRLTSG
jgi:hypothetical protein